MMAGPHTRRDCWLCGTLLSSLFHVSLSDRCCPHHRVGVVIGPEGGELAVSDPEDEREIAVVGPAGRRHVRILMTEHHDRVVGGDELVGLDDQIGQLPGR
jgi:hypothetical protein